MGDPVEHELEDADVSLVEGSVSLCGQRFPNCPLSSSVLWTVINGGISGVPSGCVISGVASGHVISGVASGRVASVDGSTVEDVSVPGSPKDSKAVVSSVGDGPFSVMRPGVVGGVFPGIHVAITIVNSPAAHRKKLLPI